MRARHDPAAAQAFSVLFAGLQHAGSALALETGLIDFLARYGFNLPADPDHARPDASPPVQRARDCIMDQLAEPLSLGELASSSGLSRYQLIRHFKHRYGQTPHAYQIDQRINRAKQLLKRGEPIADVALQLGFADQSHFQRQFKQRLATTPRHYQQCLRG